MAGTMEQQMIVKAIEEECTWEKLPKRLKLHLGTNDEWNKRVKEYCIKRRLPWADSLARTACRENEYYEDLMKYLKKNQALFPYHLAEFVCRIMRITPFAYYIDVLFEIMKQEKSYDTLPNFSAADALRMTGLGRNEFIDIMNKCRAKKLMWKINKSIVKEMLPQQCVDFPIESWWNVYCVNLSVEEHRRMSEDELSLVEKVSKNGGEGTNLVGELDIEIVRRLYRRGLVYLNVPIYADDRIQVSTLEGFVSNRDQSYEDPTEELLYAVFVASSENATVKELATTLQTDFNQLEAAVSLACRLGYAKKVMDLGAILGRSRDMPGSPTSDDSGEDNGAFFSPGRKSPLHDTDAFADTDVGLPGGHPRFAFIVDANLTSYLMMGSLSPGLKQHAVTLYEAGKLTDSSVAEMVEDLRRVEGTRLEGELQHFANHAFSLRYVLQCLRESGRSSDSFDSTTGGEGSGRGLDPSTPRRDTATRELHTTFRGSLGAPESQTSGEPSSADGPAEKAGTPKFPETTTSLLGEEFSYAAMEPAGGASDAGVETPGFVSRSSSAAEAGSWGNTTSGDVGEGEGGGREGRKPARWGSKCDVLRCESLAGLSRVTLERVMRRDYMAIVSMVPLSHPPLVSASDKNSPPHFGPPSPAAITPWMKLLFYSVAGAGPVTVALVRGQRIRVLPPPLAGCAKALVWSWDGTGVGGAGFGSKPEGTLVEGCLLLHAVNALLKHSAILVQPLPEGAVRSDSRGRKGEEGQDGRPITIDIPLPLTEHEGEDGTADPEGGSGELAKLQKNPAVLQAVEELKLNTIGYIRMLRTKRPNFPTEDEDPMLAEEEREWEWVPQSIEFGVPLFDTDLARRVCEGVKKAQLFDPASLTLHRNAMLSLRLQLRNFVADYRANGPLARAAFAESHAYPQSPWSTHGVSPFAGGHGGMLGTSAEGMLEDMMSRENTMRRRSDVLSFDTADASNRSFFKKITEKVDKVRRKRRPQLFHLPSTRVSEETPSPIIVPAGASSQLSDDDEDGTDPVLPGVNLLFDGVNLSPFDITLYLQGRQPAALVAEVATQVEATSRRPSAGGQPPQAQVGAPTAVLA